MNFTSDSEYSPLSERTLTVTEGFVSFPQAGTSPTGGRGGHGSRTFENRGVRPPQKFGFFSIFFLKRIFFAFFNNFKIKWPKSEDKLNFGSRWVWVPMNMTTPIKISWRRPCPQDRKNYAMWRQTARTAYHKCNFFSNRLGGPEDEKCPRYHQNPDGIGFLFKFDPFSCQHWGVRPTLGGSVQHSGGRALPKRYKVRYAPEQHLNPRPTGGGLFRAPPPLVFLRYLLNRCRYHRQTCSTLSPNIFTHCVKILKSRVS